MSYCGTGLDLRKTMFSFFNFKYDNMYIKNVSHLLDHRKHPKARISRVEHTLDIWFSVRDLAFCRDILGISLPGVPHQPYYMHYARRGDISSFPCDFFFDFFNISFICM